MRRWLALLLLVLMPLQFTWGAAAVYCQHEADPQATHFGHHVHVHGDSAQPSDGKQPGGTDTSQPGKSGVDSDCGACHLGAFKPVTTALPLFGPPGDAVLHALTDPAFSSQAPDHPDRPNWRIA